MKGYKLTTPEQKVEIVKLYAELGSTRMVVDRTGMSLQRIQKALRNQNIPLNNRRPVACDKHADLVKRLASEGASLSEIGRQAGTNNKRVREWLVAHNIPYIPHENKMERNGRWQGGRRIDKDGYVLLRKPDHPRADRHGYIREHRFLMEQHLDRALQAEEVVHHKDGDKQNNSIENLEVFGTNAEHLAETLKGKVPNFSEEGWERMRERGRRHGVLKRNSTAPVSEQDASP